MFSFLFPNNTEKTKKETHQNIFPIMYKYEQCLIGYYLIKGKVSKLYFSATFFALSYSCVGIIPSGFQFYIFYFYAFHFHRAKYIYEY